MYKFKRVFKKEDIALTDEGRDALIDPVLEQALSKININFDWENVGLTVESSDEDKKLKIKENFYISLNGNPTSGNNYFTFTMLFEESTDKLLGLFTGMVKDGTHTTLYMLLGADSNGSTDYFYRTTCIKQYNKLCAFMPNVDRVSAFMKVGGTVQSKWTNPKVKEYLESLGVIIRPSEQDSNYIELIAPSSIYESEEFMQVI